MLFFVTVVINGIIAFMKKNNFFIPLVGFLVLAWISGTMVSGFSFDTDAYELLYPMNPSTHRFEQGYMQLSYWSYTHGLSYSDFRLYYFLIAFSVFFIAICRFTKNRSLYLFLFSFFPFLNEASQVRNFMMYAWVLLGISFLINKTLRNTIFAIIFVTIGFLFQTTGIVFYFVIFLRYIPFSFIKKSTKIIAPVSILLGLLFYASGSSGLVAKILSFVTSLSNRQDTAEILAANGFGNRNILQTMGVVLTYLISLYAIEIMLDVKHDSKTIQSKMELLYMIVIIGLFFIPVIFVSFNFERILRNSVNALILAFTVYTYPNKVKFKGTLGTLLTVIILCGMISKGYFLNEYGKMGSYVPYILHIKSTE
ncbi:EpsG family protein [Leuconostoc mesenteroides]|uniref:EpsG family protein n=1 Tax=Leuconostoc mesenteroides TaxID=1245 RepID=UPI003CF99921